MVADPVFVCRLWTCDGDAVYESLKGRIITIEKQTPFRLPMLTVVRPASQSNLRKIMAKASKKGEAGMALLFMGYGHV